MPSPFIILDNHASVASKQFIIDNIITLKTLGYKKVLIEMNREVTTKAFKQQLKIALQGPANHPFFQASKELLRMIISLEVHGISYEFIDPETQTEAMRIGRLIQDATTATTNKEAKFAKAMAYREECSVRRDQHMAPKTIEQSKIYDGGVIVIIGYMHTHFVRMLELKQPNTYRYAMFSNDTIDAAALSQLNSSTNIGWSEMPDKLYRDNFYTARVKFFELSKKPSFEMIEAECELTARKMLDRPIIGTYLNHATGQSFDYALDKHDVLTATAHMTKEQSKATEKLIKKEFPKLRFFTEQVNEQHVLTIPGINLPENSDCLTKGLTKLDAIKP